MVIMDMEIIRETAMETTVLTVRRRATEGSR